MLLNADLEHATLNSTETLKDVLKYNLGWLVVCLKTHPFTGVAHLQLFPLAYVFLRLHPHSSLRTGSCWENLIHRGLTV